MSTTKGIYEAFYELPIITDEIHARVEATLHTDTIGKPATAIPDDTIEFDEDDIIFTDLEGRPVDLTEEDKRTIIDNAKWYFDV